MSRAVYRNGRATRRGRCPHCGEYYTAGARLVVVASITDDADVIHAVGHRTPGDCLNALLRAWRAA